MISTSLLSVRLSHGARWRFGPPIAAATMFSLVACGGGAGDGASSAVSRSSSPDVLSASASAPGTPSMPPATSPGSGEAGEEVIGTVVRFSAGSTVVELAIDEDSPAVRDFLSTLPLTLTLEESAAREKIAYLPRELAHEGSPGSDPEDGDLIYYTPWGNLGFYYNAAGIEYSDQTLHLGTYDATLDQLNLLEGADVTIEAVR